MTLSAELRRPFTAVLLLLLTGGALALAQSREAKPPRQLQQAFLDLTNDAVVMDLSAHPDDEDGGTLAYYRMKLGAKTYSVLFTRGEGGQNEKGSELYADLGVLRSEETRRAGAILGTEVFFLNFLDFGYSKTATETFRKWGGQMETLRRLVYVIRLLKPDVLFTNHNTIDGHGNHQAVAITAIAAFDAAADPAMFPEQLKLPGIALWQPKKLFFRSFGKGEQGADVVHAADETIPWLGMAPVDIATEALRMHRTQGMDRADLRSWGRGKRPYRLMRSSSLFENDSTSFLGGIDLLRDPDVAPLRQARRELDRWHLGVPRDSLLLLERRIAGLCDSLSALPVASSLPLARRIIDHWKENASRIVALSCDVAAVVRLADTVVVAGQQVPATLDVTSRECTLDHLDVRFDLPDGWTWHAREGRSVQGSERPGPDSRHEQRGYMLQVGEGALPTLPRAVAQYTPIERVQHLRAEVSLSVDGAPLRLTLEPAVDVAPDQLLTVDPRRVHLSPSLQQRSLHLGFRVTNYLPRPSGGAVRAELPPGWRAEPVPFKIAREDSSVAGFLTVRAAPHVPKGEYRLRMMTERASVPVEVAVFDVRLAPEIRLGIIASYDTTIEAAAHELGIQHTLLDDAALGSRDLSGFTSIIIDIRAYLVREGLQRANARLLDYVRGGGNLIVMYQRPQEWKPEYAPFPFRISGRRVTVEEAPVFPLLPDHPLLTQPNRIAASDWEGWKQERGLYFPGEVPAQYQRLVATGDPDEELLDSGYLVASYGKGSYIYTSLAWYRQLKEENQGAFRCFANMISYPAYRK